MTGTIRSLLEHHFYALRSEPRPIYNNEYIYVIILMTVTLLLVLFAWLKATPQREDGLKRPLLYPCSIPVFGHLLLLAWDTPRLISSVTTRFRDVPVRVRLLFTEIYVISGPESIQEVWKEPDVHTKAYKALSIHNMFKMSKDTLNFWNEDDSGHHAQPRPGSNVPPHLRVDYLTHSSILRFLSGDGLQPFARRFMSTLGDQLLTKGTIHSEWSDIPDLFGFLQAELLPATIEAIWGKLFCLINPAFVEDFWTFSSVLPELAKGYPRWLAPKPYKARDKCFESVKRWHTIIWKHFHETPVAGEDWNENYGTELVRSRHMAWSKMPRMDADAAATEDLGMIWATNGNSIPAAYWMLAEVLSDKALLSRVRSIIDSYRIDSGLSQIGLDYARLCADPLLQSIYAETLRLHTSCFIMRGPIRADFTLKGRHIPKDAVMLISSYNAQTDPRGWRTNEKQPARPINQFCAERFLVYQNPEKGSATPCNVSYETQRTSPKQFNKHTKESTAPEFSLKGYSDYWIPYGGGQRMCPGRHFAKLEILSTFAMMLTLFDVELAQGAGTIPENEMGGFGFGTLWPKGKTPVRIRRRAS